MGLSFTCLANMGGGGVRKGWRNYPYLLVLTKLWPGDWDNKLIMMKTRLYEYNKRSMGMGK